MADEHLIAGKYRVLRHLASGGMGEVCLAVQEGPADYERVVAVKRMLPNLNTHREVLKLFLDEARLIALLHHRNICQIVELGEDDDGYFVAMEFVNGASVQSLLSKLHRQGKRLEPYYAVEIAAQVAEALSYAYTAPGRDGQPLQIIHRDVTPHNVLLSTAGDVKLIDFGVAKSSQQQHSTENGIVKGKLGYLSPEQSKGKALDDRSDLFSLGIMLYEMITGENPFARPDLVATVRAIQSEEVPPLDALRTEWAALWPVVSRLLAKSPDERYENANAAAEALLDLRQILPRPPKRLGPFIADSFGQELVELARSISDTNIRARLEAAIPRAEETSDEPLPVPAPVPSESPSNSTLPLPLASASAPTSSPAPATVMLNDPTRMNAAAAPETLLFSAPSRTPEISLRSRNGLIWGAVGLVAIVGVGLWIGNRTSPEVAPPKSNSTPPSPSVSDSATSSVRSAPPPPTELPHPSTIATSGSASSVVPPSEIATKMDDAPKAISPPSKSHPDRASTTSSSKHRHVDVASSSKQAAEKSPPTATTPETTNVAASPSLGTLRVSGLAPRVLNQPSGHLDLQDPSGHFKIGLDYAIAQSQMKVQLSSTPWAIVYVNGSTNGKTKDRAVELPQIGSAPVRIELEHPDMEKARLVMTFEPH